MVKVCKGCFKFTLSFNISLWETENCIAQGQKLNECWTWTHPYWIVGAVSIYSTPTKKFMVHVDLQSRKSIQVAASILLVCWLALVWFGLVVRSSRLCTRSALPRFSQEVSYKHFRWERPSKLSILLPALKRLPRLGSKSDGASQSLNSCHDLQYVEGKNSEGTAQSTQYRSRSIELDRILGCTCKHSEKRREQSCLRLSKQSS